MAKRSRRDLKPNLIDRAPMSRTAPPRDTMRVARANRVLAESLPNVVLSTPKPTRPRLTIEAETISPGRREAVSPRRVEKPERRDPPSPKLEKLAECHPRPKKTKGNGGSRKFAGRYC